MDAHLKFMLENKVIVICRKVYGQELIHLADAILTGGIRMLEVTFDQSDPDNLDKTAQAIALLKETFGVQLLVGAGTVLSCAQVDAAAQAGAAYIVSPNTDREVIVRTKELGLLSVPGAMTPTEIISAHQYGADLVKLFPAAALGVGYIKDIRSPINHVKLLATGGINDKNMADFFKAGCVGIGIGGQLCDLSLVAAGDFAAITARARRFAEIAQNA